MTKVLLTGFEPFGKATLNPSGEIVKQISGDNIVTAILPVAYAQSAEALLALIEHHKPDVVISLGQAEGRTQITPERIAINLDDARLADNEGVTRIDEPILVDGPVAYESTLPIKAIVEAIKIAIFELIMSSLLSKANRLIKIDIVNPIPPKIATPNIEFQFKLLGSTPIPSSTPK